MESSDSGEFVHVPAHSEVEASQAEAAQPQEPEAEPFIAGEFHMPASLVRIDDNQRLVLDQQALAFLRTLPKPIHCITLAGVAREGKSTWLTMFLRWLDQQRGKGDTTTQFRISKGVVTCTSGSWMWGTTEVRSLKAELVPKLIVPICSAASRRSARFATAHGHPGSRQRQSRRTEPTVHFFRAALQCACAQRAPTGAPRPVDAASDQPCQVNDDTLNKLGAVSALSKLVQGSVDIFPELIALVSCPVSICTEHAGRLSLYRP